MLFKKIKPTLLALVLMVSFAIIPGTADAASSRGVSLTAKNIGANHQWGDYHALIIGINDYQKWPRLNTAVKDAKVLYQLLIDKYGFRRENTTLRLDKAASRENIIRDLRRIAGTMEPDDNLLIYYAGHGQLDRLTGDGYWIPAEGEMKETWTWVSNSLIKSLLGSERFEAKNVLVIADSCYSGAMLRGGPSLLQLTAKGYVKKLMQAAARRSRQVISSGGLEPVVDGGADGHSLFAYYLIKALRENDQEVIDLENLFHTRVWKPVTDIGDQRPNVGRLKSPMDDDGQFVLYNAGWAEEKRRRIEAQGRQNTNSTEGLTDLQAQRQRLELERRKLELELEKIELEKQRQELEKRKAANQLAMVTPNQGASESRIEPSGYENRVKSVAILPIKGLTSNAWYNQGTLQIDSAEAMALATDKYANLVISHSFYPKLGSTDTKPIELTEEERGRLWEKATFFSSPKPDVSRIAQMGRQLGFDYALCCLGRDSVHGAVQQEVSIFIIDVAREELHKYSEDNVRPPDVVSAVEDISKRMLQRLLKAQSARNQ